jgi:acetyl-CoA synthetase
MMAVPIWDIGWEVLGLGSRDQLNACHAVVDRHCAQGDARTALIWRDYQGSRQTLTFQDLRDTTSRFASALLELGLESGDRVFTLLEPVPELYTALLGAIRAGGIAGPMFPGFGTDAIRDRLQDSGARFLVTAAHHLHKVREALKGLSALQNVLVVGDAAAEGSEVRLADLLSHASADVPCRPTSPDNPMLLHYSSGTTGRPKGVLHVHEAVVGHAATARVVLDLQPNDIYWCTADPGWVTGTSYGVFGPWANGVTQVAYVGGFSSEAWYQVIAQERVTVWYTSPTALRMLMRDGTQVARGFDLSSLRHICSVGEPLNPEVIRWASEAFGLTVHDTWWQTETGCMQICNYPFMRIKPGSMGRPLVAAGAAVIDPKTHEELPAGREGLIALRPQWPSMFRAYWGRYELYAARFRNGWYVTEDRAYVDTDGYFWFVGRDDDVINTSGHLVGPFEVESALIEHPAVAEAAAFSVPAEDTGEAVVAKVVLIAGHDPDRSLVRDLKTLVRREVGPYAVPRQIEVVDRLPRTRSGKIMRRVARAQYLGLPVGDTSGLEE